MPNTARAKTSPSPPAEHHTLERHALLDRAQCDRARDDVLALRDLWVKRVGEAPFYTLGAAAYLDGDPDREPYSRFAQGINPLMSLQFGWLLDAVSRTISEAMGLKTQWLEGSALPGFHIYLASPLFTGSVAEIHFDRQYELVDWSQITSQGVEPDFSAPLSFTLPVDLPSIGGGLNTWPVNETEAKRAMANGIEPPMTFHPYCLGELVMHSGNLLHQAALALKMNDNERRITLQGHGIRARDTMYLYW